MSDISPFPALAGRRPRVIIAMNALRFGGSQTFAGSLTSRLERCGLEPIVVAKSGEQSSTFMQRWKVHHVLWAEGEGSAGGVRQGVARCAGYASLCRLRYALRGHPPIAWIASQPWPIHYATVTRRVLWPETKRIGLIHGTTGVEIPPPGGTRELAAMDRLYTSTPEAAAVLDRRYGVPAKCIGNLFDADDYWGRPRLPARDDLGVGRILFLGTLTSNKVPPLRALLNLVAEETAGQVTVVGDGSERTGLEELVAQRRIGDRVRFRGSLTDPRDEIERAQLVVAAGRAAIEAGSRPRRVIVATAEGVFGALTPERIDFCKDYNFTGRTPGSGPATRAEMTRAVREAREIDTTALAANASKLSQVGSIDPLVGFLRSQQARTAPGMQ